MTPESLRCLATCIEVHLSVRAGLIAWPAELSEDEADEARRIAALVRLGVPPDEACACVLGDRADEIAVALGRGERIGGRVARSVRLVADRMEERAIALNSRDGTAAGARLSCGIVILVLALGWLVTVAGSGFTWGTLAASCTGGALVAAGVRWMVRSKPGLHGDAEERLALALADGIEGGASVDLVLGHLVEEGAFGELLRSCLGTVQQGALWPEALAASAQAEIRAIGRACVQARRHGRPLAPALRTIAANAARLREGELAGDLRRAPIRMVVPLALCVLPGSLLVAAAPLFT